MATSRIIRLLTATAVGLGAAGVAQAQSIGGSLVTSGLVRPIFVTHAPNDFSRIFIIEKQGRIRIFDLTTNTLLATPFLDIDPIVTGGTTANSEQGLLGLAFHPNYAVNGYFYVNYTAVAGAGDTVVARYSVLANNPNQADAGSALTIMTFDQPQTNHNGGWMDFGSDDYLYIATGDGGNADDVGPGHTEPGGNGQDITSMRLGKMLRVDVNGDDFPGDATNNYAVPPTNPFVGVTGDDEIWSYGLRNPWRNGFDRLTGDLWMADVGQNLVEEINFEPAGVGGRNYGWRCYEGDAQFTFDSVCQAAGAFTFPIRTYGHGLGCSITGGYVYRGCAIPALQGTYFYADFCSNSIWSFQYVGGVVVSFTNRTTQLDPPGTPAIVSIVSFGEDAYGEIYICDQSGGEIFKIVPTTPASPDCNENLISDDCEILANPAIDANQNGVIDTCETGCPGDVNGDGQTNLTDLSQLLAAFGTSTGNPGFNPAADFNNSGTIDLSDLSVLLANFGC